MTLLYDKYTKAEAVELLKIGRTQYRFGFAVAFVLFVLNVVAFFLGAPWLLQVILFAMVIGFFVWALWTAEVVRITIADMAEIFSTEGR